jgi:hypothetical protein
MRKFKSFSVGVTDTTDMLDNAVNAWLSKHDNKIEIVNTETRTLAGKNYLGHNYVNITVTIWYEELEPVGGR